MGISETVTNGKFLTLNGELIISSLYVNIVFCLVSFCISHLREHYRGVIFLIFFSVLVYDRKMDK